MPKRIARWNPARDVWEAETTGLFCEHSDVYSETFPSSGTTRGGTAYELPMSVPLTAGSGSSSLLPTPAAMNPNDGESVETWEARRQRVALTAANGNGFGTPLAIAIQLLPTPRTSDTNGAGLHGTGGPDLRTVIDLLPTPTCGDAKSARNSTATRHRTPPTGVHAGDTLTDILVPLRGASTSSRHKEA